MRRVVTFSCAAFALLFGIVSAQAHSSKEIIWGGWKFYWEVKDHAGLALRDLYFNNELVAFKISMPAVRVRYSDKCKELPYAVTCGPYLDRIKWDNMSYITNCNNKKVCMKSFESDGRNWLEVSVVARIGAYRLWQVYYLSHDGWIHVELASRGLHAPADHDHHAYWRFDFYINFNPNEEIVRYSGGLTIAAGTQAQEFNDTRGSPTQPHSWLIRDPASDHGVAVYRGWWADGLADSFSGLDVAGRLYKLSEDVGWKFGVKGELGYNEQEGIQGKDSVFWYVGHLHHDVKEEDIVSGIFPGGWMYNGDNEYHKTGARLFVKR